MRTHLVAFALATRFAGAAYGQVVQVDASALSARHELLGDPLRGAALTLRTAPRGPRISLDVSGARAKRTGSMCYGLVPPSGCPSEPLSDRSVLVTAGVGWDVWTSAAGRLSFVPTLDARLAWIDVETRGQTSGDRIDANKRFLDAMAGGQVRLALSNRWAIHFGGDIGVMHPLTVVHVEDGYTPFEEGFRFFRFAAGGTWTPRP
jgi:hypothetical protein